MTMQELFNKCLADTNQNKVRAARRFLVSAKKENPKITMKECMAICGYTHEDPKKAASLAQTFRSAIVNPTREHLAKIKYQMEDGSMLFKRGIQLSEADKQKKKEIESMLPSRNRKSDDMSYLKDIV